MFSLEKEQLFIGMPIPLKETICLVYPLTALEIFKLTQTQYNYYLNLLILEEEDLKEIYKKKNIELEENISPFTYILRSCEYDSNFLLDIKKAFFTFIRERVQILPEDKVIIVGDLKDKRIIDEEAFYELQQILRLQNGIEPEEEIPEDENEMQKKFRLRRKELKKAKKKQAQKNIDEDNSIDFYCMVKALLIKKIINYEELNKITLYAIHELFTILQAEEEYNNGIKFLCAGADPKKNKITYWIRKTYDK